MNGADEHDESRRNRLSDRSSSSPALRLIVQRETEVTLANAESAYKLGFYGEFEGVKRVFTCQIQATGAGFGRRPARGESGGESDGLNPPRDTRLHTAGKTQLCQLFVGLPLHSAPGCNKRSRLRGQGVRAAPLPDGHTPSRRVIRQSNSEACAGSSAG